MKCIRVLSLLLLILAIAQLGVVSVSALADYRLDWWTVYGGGAITSTGGDYSLGGSIGQPDAGLRSGGNYTLAGGFWGGLLNGNANHYIYLPLITR
jgi:hypothetical protein